MESPHHVNRDMHVTWDVKVEHPTLSYSAQSNNLHDQTEKLVMLDV